MTSKQYIKQLTSAEENILGRDVPQTARASVIDGLCGVIDAQKTLLADKDILIAKLQAELEKYKKENYA